MLARSVGENIDKHHVDPLADLPEKLVSADLAILNLECAICSELPDEIDKKFIFQARPQSATNILKQAGMDLVSFANNHSGDGGEAGLLETIRHLKNTGIAGFGHPEMPVRLVKKKGVTVAFIGVYREIDLVVVDKAVRDSDLAIAFVHWDCEHNPGVAPEQTRMVQQLTSLGVNLVVGSGTHCVQKSDIVNESSVFYSLGDLVFDKIPSHRHGFLLEVLVDSRGGICGINEIPYQIEQSGFPVLPLDTQ